MAGVPTRRPSVFVKTIYSSTQEKNLWTILLLKRAGRACQHAGPARFSNFMVLSLFPNIQLYPVCILFFLDFDKQANERVIIGRVLRLRRITHRQNYSSFDSLLSGLEHLGKGWIVRVATTRRLPYWSNRLFYPSWNRLQLIGSSVADCQALT